jgi:hypothetical protein
VDLLKTEFLGFLERLSSGTTSRGEWERFVVTHYVDPATEAARVDLVRAAICDDPWGLHAEISQALRDAARSIRARLGAE